MQQPPPNAADHTVSGIGFAKSFSERVSLLALSLSLSLSLPLSLLSPDRSLVACCLLPAGFCRRKSHISRFSLLRGNVLNRTYGRDKNLYISLFLLTMFGPIYYGPPEY